MNLRKQLYDLKIEKTTKTKTSSDLDIERILSFYPNRKWTEQPTDLQIGDIVRRDDDYAKVLWIGPLSTSSSTLRHNRVWAYWTWSFEDARKTIYREGEKALSDGGRLSVLLSKTIDGIIKVED